MASRPTVASTNIPFGFTAEVQTCTTCGHTPVVATITRPVSDVVQNTRAAGIITIPAGIDPQYSLFSMTEFPSAALSSESTRAVDAQHTQGLVMQSGLAPGETLLLSKSTSQTEILHETVTAHDSHPVQTPTFESLSSSLISSVPTTASRESSVCCLFLVEELTDGVGPIANAVSSSAKEHSPVFGYKCMMAVGLILMKSLIG